MAIRGACRDLAILPQPIVGRERSDTRGESAALHQVQGGSIIGNFIELYDATVIENFNLNVAYLQFRVAILLKSSQPHNSEPIVSAPSVVIQTMANGLPTSAPIIVRAAAVDSCRVSVSWEPGPFPNGPLLSYVLRLQGDEHSQHKVSNATPEQTT